MKTWIIATLSAALLTAALPGAASENQWPTRPIRVIVPFPVGGVLDVVTRAVTQRVSPALGQPIVVDVRAGADGNIGTEMAARAAPDGYTWIAVSPPTTIQPSIRPKTLKYDPIRDFEPVVYIGTSPFLFAVPASAPSNTLKDFVAHAKAQAGKLSYAGSARGTVVHLATELFMHDMGLKMVMVNYAGQPAAMLDLLAGRVDFMALGLLLAEPQIKAGKLKALVLLDEQRHPQLPGVPSAAEVGLPDLIMQTWFGLAMPTKSPAPIVQRVHAEVTKALQSPELRSQLQGMGVDVAKPSSPQEFGRFMREDVARWKKVVSKLALETD
jgi:tripartite-type tricarboxylate transporter receptor subunit TctC